MFYNLPLKVYDRLNKKPTGYGNLIDTNIRAHHDQEYKQYKKKMNYNEFSGVDARFTPKYSTV